MCYVSGGKPSSMVVVEVEHIMELIMRAMPKEVVDLLEPIIMHRLGSAGSAAAGSDAAAAAAKKQRSASLSAMSYDSVSNILINLPSSQRNLILLKDDYVSIQEGVVQYSGQVISAIGAIWLNVENPILVYLRRQRFTTLYLGMVMDILIAILLGLSSVLIYRCVVLCFFFFIKILFFIFHFFVHYYFIFKKRLNTNDDCSCSLIFDCDIYLSIYIHPFYITDLHLLFCSCFLSLPLLTV